MEKVKNSCGGQGCTVTEREKRTGYFEKPKTQVSSIKRN